MAQGRRATGPTPARAGRRAGRRAERGAHPTARPDPKPAVGRGNGRSGRTKHGKGDRTHSTKLPGPTRQDARRPAEGDRKTGPGRGGRGRAPRRGAADARRQGSGPQAAARKRPRGSAGGEAATPCALSRAAAPPGDPRPCRLPLESPSLRGDSGTATGPSGGATARPERGQPKGPEPGRKRPYPL